jgi:hypothetical protein
LWVLLVGSALLISFRILLNYGLSPNHSFGRLAVGCSG